MRDHKFLAPLGANRTKDLTSNLEASHIVPEPPSRALRSSSAADICRVAKSTGLQQDCRWYQRLASTIRLERQDYNLESDGSDAAARPGLIYDNAVQMYMMALELDSSDSIARSGFGLALAAQEKYADAARESSAAIELFAAAIRKGEPSPNPNYSLASYKIDTQQEYATHCLNAGNTSEAFRAYECATKDLETFDINADGWEEMASITASYFYDLYSKKMWDEAGRLLVRLNSHTHRSSEPFHIIYRLMAYNDTPLLQIGYHTKNLASLADFMNHALSSTARQDGDSAVTSVALAFANILLRLESTRGDEAVTMLEAVASHNHTREYAKGWAERELARHFLKRALQEREDDHWQAVAEFVNKLIRLVFGEEMDPTSSNSEGRDILAAWYQLNGLHTRAMQCVRSDVTLGIDLLSDTDPDNDTMAWHTLMDSLLATGDATRAVAAVNMLRSGLFEDPTPSHRNSDAGHIDTDSTARSDEDTTAGAANETAEESRDVPQHSPSPPSTEDRPAQDTDHSTAKEPTLNPGYPFFSCDGCCFESIANNAHMWRCSYCITDFCESCHLLITRNQMTGWNVCDSLHHHVPIPGISAKYPKDMIKVEDEYKPVEDYVQELRKEWVYFKSGN